MLCLNFFSNKLKLDGDRLSPADLWRYVKDNYEKYQWKSALNSLASRPNEVLIVFSEDKLWHSIGSHTSPSCLVFANDCHEILITPNFTNLYKADIHSPWCGSLIDLVIFKDGSCSHPRNIIFFGKQMSYQQICSHEKMSNSRHHHQTPARDFTIWGKGKGTNFLTFGEESFQEFHTCTSSFKPGRPPISLSPFLGINFSMDPHWLQWRWHCKLGELPLDRHAPLAACL